MVGGGEAGRPLDLGHRLVQAALERRGGREVLDPAARRELLDVIARLNRIGFEAHRTLGGLERRPGWAEMWDAGSGDQILARSAWFEAQRDDLLAFLR